MAKKYFSLADIGERIAKKWGRDGDDISSLVKTLSDPEKQICLLASLNEKLSKFEKMGKHVFNLFIDDICTSFEQKTENEFDSYHFGRCELHGDISSALYKYLHRIFMKKNMTLLAFRFYFKYNYCCCDKSIEPPKKGTKLRVEYNAWIKRTIKKPKEEA